MEQQVREGGSLGELPGAEGRKKEEGEWREGQRWILKKGKGEIKGSEVGGGAAAGWIK